MNLQLPKSSEGQAPGEAYLDLLRSLGKTFGPFVGVLAVTCIVIYGVHRFTDLDTARAAACRTGSVSSCAALRASARSTFASFNVRSPRRLALTASTAAERRPSSPPVSGKFCSAV